MVAKVTIGVVVGQTSTLDRSRLIDTLEQSGIEHTLRFYSYSGSVEALVAQAKEQTGAKEDVDWWVGIQSEEVYLVSNAAGARRRRIMRSADEVNEVARFIWEHFYR